MVQMPVMGCTLVFIATVNVYWEIMVGELVFCRLAFAILPDAT